MIIITESDIRALNAARTILQRIETECISAAWGATTDVRDDGPHAHDYGRVAAKADTAADILFDTINHANVHLSLDLSDDVLFNRPTAVPA